MTHDPLGRNHVTVLGDPAAARTLVFVHGFGTDQSAWQEVAAEFSADCRIVLLDNVGAGRSDAAAFVQHHYLNLQRYADDLVEVCEALALRDAILVGHSVGAMICALASVKRPAIASRLVLIAASPRYLNGPGYHGGFTEEDLSRLYSAVTGGYHTWAEQFAPLAMGPGNRPALAQHFADTLKRIAPEQALTVLCSIFQSDHRADLESICRPTLLVQSQEDIAVPREVAEYLQRHIAGSELRVIEATGHLPHVSAPHAVAAAMREFVYR